ncbi:hypothetical protein DSO57_1013759 [Entomophthora muscae]|uniref:Uncharacterized protein n=2 Tax=Entomophthora muscae TaxID=34485 RepID=A0ACC2RKB4_9FUNG|nr:hypothetical protein DSO57_1013759 [Entomophthora muscae]
MTALRSSGTRKRISLNDVKQQKSRAAPEAKKKKANEECKEVTSESEVSSANPWQYWLMKAEPESRIVKGVDVKFSIDDLEKLPSKISPWDGVRNYEARNSMRDKMRLGDKILFYHSNCKVPGVAGIAEVVKEGYPDDSALDPKHPYYDSKSTSDDPRWFRVDVKFVEKFAHVLSLKLLKAAEHQKALSNMVLLKRPQLSVQPVNPDEFEYIVKLSKSETQ